MCKQACQIEVITRQINYRSKLFIGGEPGQIKYKYIDEFKQEIIDEVTSNSDVVINLIGILYETRLQNFDFVHSEIPNMIARACKKNKIRYFIHISALNVDKVKDSKYAQSKLKGERFAKESFKDVTIIRPGVVFGKGDNFTNFFYNMSKFSPILPVIGTPEISKGKSFFPKIDFSVRVKFQPVYVGDLVKFIISKCLTKSKSYEVAGPEVYSFNEIFDIILKSKSKRRIYLPLPFFIATILAFVFERLPKSLLTRDQIKLLKKNNISSSGLQTLKSIIRNPTSLDSIIHTYI